MSRRTFVTLHGFGFDSSIFLPLALRLRKAGHRVVTLDTPGRSGDPTPPRDLTIQGYVEDLVHEIKNLHEERVILLAHDFGGVYAAGIADRIRVHQIVFLSALVPHNGVLFRPPFLDFVDLDPDGYLRVTNAVDYGSLILNDAPQSMKDWYVGHAVAEPFRPLSGQPGGFVAGFPVGKRFLETKRVYIGFQDDRIIPVSLQHQMIAATPTRYVPFPGSNFAIVTDPGPLAQRILVETDQSARRADGRAPQVPAALVTKTLLEQGYD